MTNKHEPYSVLIFLPDNTMETAQGALVKVKQVVETLRRSAVTAAEFSSQMKDNGDAMVAAHRLAESLGDINNLLDRSVEATTELSEHYPDRDFKPYSIDGEGR